MVLFDGRSIEKIVFLNLSFGGFDVVDVVKVVVEKVCLGVVLCVDVFIIVVRVFVFMVGDM